MIVGAMASMALPGAVAAQAGGAGPQRADAPAGLEEIVVTARKREETLQDVPLTVTAITGETIGELNLKGIEDLGRFTPGFSYTSAFGRQGGSERPAVRGQATILGDPVASFFVDGVYVNGPSMATEIANVERVEVIKGPQSALYGRATYAGAINYITRRPTNEHDGRLSASVAQHDEHDATGWLSGPIVQDRLYYYASLRTFSYGGEYRNGITGRDVGGESTDGATFKLLWTPAAGFAATLLGSWAQVDDDHFAIALQGRGFNNCRLRNVAVNPPVNPRSRGYYCGEARDADQLGGQVRLVTNLFPEGGGIRARDRRAALTLDWELPRGYEMVSTSGWHKYRQDSELDVSYGGYDPFVNLPPPLGGPNAAGTFWRLEAEEREDFGQELRLRSPGDSRFRWLAGVYYFKGNVGDVRDDAVRPTGVVFRNPGGTLSERKIENRALFGGLELDFTGQLTGTVEVRRGEDEISQQAYNPVTGAPAGFLEGEFRSTSPRITLRYKPVPSLALYANVAEGTKPGTFNSANAIAAGFPAAVKEEETRNYEIGAKTRWRNGRVQADLALYQTDLTNQQLTQNVAIRLPSGAEVLNSVIVNLGETEIRGVELTLNALLTERWDVQLGVGLNDPEVKAGTNVDQADLYAPIPRTATAAEAATRPPTTPPGTIFANASGNPVAYCRDGSAPGIVPVVTPTNPSCAQLNVDVTNTYGNLAGQQTPRAPRAQGYLVSTYRGAVGTDLGWFLSADVTYEGSKWAQLDNLIETGAATRVGLRLGLEAERWNVTLWGKNIFDDATPTDILRYIDTQGLTAAQFTSPQFGSITPRGFALTLPRRRQFGVTAAYRF
jgi:outer membrane receptor protein involved in Fe transport